MNELKSEPAELSFTVTIKRKETGKIETYDLVGYIEQGEQDGSNTQHSSEKRSD